MENRAHDTLCHAASVPIGAFAIGTSTVVVDIIVFELIMVDFPKFAVGKHHIMPFSIKTVGSFFYFFYPKRNKRDQEQ